MRRLAPFVAVLAVFGLLAAGATAAEDQVVVLGKGQIGSYHWFVAGMQDESRKGICFEVGAYRRTPENGVEGRGQCSASAVKRGILIVVTEPAKKSHRVVLTAVGAAFNKAVKAVEVRSFDGTTERLVPHSPPSSAAESTVAHFRYLAFAVKGPWCAERVETINAAGKPLWETDWEDIGGFRKRHDPRNECPGF